MASPKTDIAKLLRMQQSGDQRAARILNTARVMRKKADKKTGSIMDELFTDAAKVAPEVEIDEDVGSIGRRLQQLVQAVDNGEINPDDIRERPQQTEQDFIPTEREMELIKLLTEKEDLLNMYEQETGIPRTKFKQPEGEGVPQRQINASPPIS